VAQVQRSRILAWTLGGGGSVACALTLWLTLAVGLGSEEVLILPTFIASGLLGALIASRAPRNSVGWLMCAASFAAILLFLPLDYGYEGQVTHLGSWPGGGVALWFGAWAWTPLIGLFLPLLTVRFPDGVRPPWWRAVDRLAAAGTVVLAAGVALLPADALHRFLLIPSGLHASIGAYIDNPLGSAVPGGAATVAVYAGFVLIILAYAASVGSVVDRFRRARGDERLQLKWFVYCAALLLLVLMFGALIEISGAVPPISIEIAYHLAFFALPLGIAIAVLRYRLYDIDLLINRTLVYVSLTAILGALYAAVVTFVNRLFITLSGQKSDAAYVLTAFAVAVAFGPLKDWLQRQVDRRIGRSSAPQMLDEFRSTVEAVVSVIDVERVVHQLLDRAVVAFNARGAALYLVSHGDGDPVYSRGEMNGGRAVEVPLRHEGRDVGRLVMGSRRGDAAYSDEDCLALQRSADSVAEAIALAEQFGHVRVPVAR
jgi:two-component system, NarL family, sensor kinase